MKEIKYLDSETITRRILEFPPVKNDEDLENFQKLVGKMWIAIQPLLRDSIGKQLDKNLLIELENLYPFVSFYEYGGHIGINFKQDYLEEHNLCLNAFGGVERKNK